jgi:hypothetical protein
VRPAGRRYLEAALTGLVAGYCLALVLGRSVWLDMRVNIGNVIPVSVTCFVFFLRMRKRPMGVVPFLLLELLAAALLTSTYGFSSSTILIVPSSLFREGFHLNSFSLTKINLFLLCLFGTANGVWIYAVVMGRRRKRRSHFRMANQEHVR